MLDFLKNYSEVIASTFYIIAAVVSAIGVIFGFKWLRVLLYRNDYYPIRIEKYFLIDEKKCKFKFVNLGKEDIKINKISLYFGHYDLTTKISNTNIELKKTIVFSKYINWIPVARKKDKSNTHAFNISTNAINISTSRAASKIKNHFNTKERENFIEFQIIYTHKGIKKIISQLYDKGNKKSNDKYIFQKGSIKGVVKKI